MRRYGAVFLRRSSCNRHRRSYHLSRYLYAATNLNGANHGCQYHYHRQHERLSDTHHHRPVLQLEAVESEGIQAALKNLPASAAPLASAKALRGTLSADGNFYFTWTVEFTGVLIYPQDLGWQTGSQTVFEGGGPYNQFFIVIDAANGALLKRTAVSVINLVVGGAQL